MLWTLVAASPLSALTLAGPRTWRSDMDVDTWRPLPLLAAPLASVPLVGEVGSLPLPQEAFLRAIADDGERRCFGLLLRTSKDQVVSWSPLLQVDELELHSLRVRCIGRVSIAQLKPARRLGPSSTIAQAKPLYDAPLRNSDELDRFERNLSEVEELYAGINSRWSRISTLQAPESVTVAPKMILEDTTLTSLGRDRHDALGHVLLGEESAPAAAQRVLTSFAAFDRDLATWKVRLAAMQCSDSVARLALARRTMQWTTRRLDAEISLRCAL